MVPWIPQSLHSVRHFDRFSRFCTADSCVPITHSQTDADRHTDHATCDICRNSLHLCTYCMRWGLKIRPSIRCGHGTDRQDDGWTDGQFVALLNAPYGRVEHNNTPTNISDVQLVPHLANFFDVFGSGPLTLCYESMTPSTKPGVLYRGAIRGGPNHDHKQHAQKFVEVRPCGFRVMRADRQTNGHTRRNTELR